MGSGSLNEAIIINAEEGCDEFGETAFHSKHFQNSLDRICSPLSNQICYEQKLNETADAVAPTSILAIGPLRSAGVWALRRN